MNPAIVLAAAAAAALLARHAAAEAPSPGVPGFQPFTTLGEPIPVHAGERWRVSARAALPVDQRPAMEQSMRATYNAPGSGVQLLSGPLWSGDVFTVVLEYTRDTQIYRARLDFGGGIVIEFVSAVRVA